MAGPLLEKYLKAGLGWSCEQTIAALRKYKRLVIVSANCPLPFPSGHGNCKGSLAISSRLHGGYLDCMLVGWSICVGPPPSPTASTEVCKLSRPPD